MRTDRCHVLKSPTLLIYFTTKQVKQLLSELCILPLGSSTVHSKVPLTKTVMIYGPSMTGKTLLTHIATHAAGANLFDLSPRNTDGCYPGKASALMVHMVFKVVQFFVLFCFVFDIITHLSSPSIM